MAFGFARKTLKESGILRGMTDYHSHVLPGVDDGFQSMGDSLKALKAFEDLGIGELWLTPHVMVDYPNETEDLRRRFGELTTAYGEVAGPNPVRLHLASENMLDSLFVKRLVKDDFLPFIDGAHLLVETSYFNPPYGMDDLLAGIKRHGYTPVLAHPERYRYMSMPDYKRLHEGGVLLQLDLFSVLGAYDRDSEEKSHALLKKGFYSMLGSDVHDLEHYLSLVEVPVKKSVLRALERLVESQGE